MEIRQMLRPLGNLPPATPLSLTRTSAIPSIASQRHQSTTSRTKKMLKIAPHPDFLTPAMSQNHIIYNPPAASSSVYHTPFKFLPKSDPRRQANIGRLLRMASGAPESPEQTTKLPPPSGFYDPNFNKYTMTLEQVEEMRRLRAEDPIKWSVLRLAEKFNCRPVFVMKCCKTSAEHRASEAERLAAIRARWSPAKVQAKTERQKRRTMLLRGQL
ncbi:hypothetical protein F4861DRAFT_134490 [Xylaria intraflava]|nr:hypothetical protein F4861DRAFT_134490 [Xylaria intraflava]